MASSRNQDQLLDERRSMLVQLYCISNINELKNSENHERIGKEIEHFTEHYDFAKGTPIDLKDLPKLKPKEPFVEKRLARSKSSSPSEIKKDLKKRSKDTTPTGGEEQITSTLSSSQSSGQTQRRQSQIFQQLPKQLPMQQVQQQAPVRKATGTESEPSALNKYSIVQTSETEKLQDEIPSTKRAAEQEDEYEGPLLKRTKGGEEGKSRANLQEDEQIELPPSSYHMMDISQLHAEPTPIEVKQRDPYIVASIECNKKKNRAGSNSWDSNVKDTVYLLTNETAPVKLAKAMPIQELKYVSQTLPLLKLIPQSQKALTTELINTALNEGRITVVASRIEELRRLNLWSLRQPKKFIDPIGGQQFTHSKLLIEEAKWMREDFHETQKYKISMCILMAQSVMDYWKYGKICCIKRKDISHLVVNEETMKISRAQDSSTPDDETSSIPLASLTAVTGELALDEKKQDNLIDTPSKNVDVKLLTKKICVSHEIISHQLPETSLSSFLESRPHLPFKPHVNVEKLTTLAAAVTNALPVYTPFNPSNLESKQLLFEPVSKGLSPLDEDHFMKLIEKQVLDDEPSLVPLSKRRGMFYGNRRGHNLRPPTAPSLRYLKFRTPTIWLPEDDQELVKNINQYAYNWELISSQMSNYSIRGYVSNIERRTPWQCFERFVQLNEKFNVADMKGPKAHNAQIWLYEAHKLQQQQKRRISPLGVGSESIQRGHRRLRWASMFEAMRKCIKKRENAPRPNPSQPRKPLDVKNMAVPTPQEMSELKAQRDEALRRDIQLKRAAKQRIQIAQYQQQMSKLPHTAASTPNLPVTSTVNGKEHKGRTRQGTPQSAPLVSEKMKVTTQTPPQRNMKPVTEKEIIEGYARKILLQKPDFTPELALKAAESYYRNVTLRQQQLKAAAPASQPTAGRADAKNISPTPQEILQRAQKGD